MQNNREKLHTQIGSYFKKNNVVLTKTQWLLTYFKDEASVTNLFNHVQTGKQRNPTKWNVVPESDIKSFFKAYACDIVTSSYCQSSDPNPQPNPQPNPPANTNTIGAKFQCLVNDPIYGGMVEPIDDTHVFFHEDKVNVEYHFYSNGKFRYVDKGNGQSLDGNWSCKGNNGFIARTSDGFYFASKNPGWKSTSVNETVIKKIVGDNLKSLLK